MTTKTSPGARARCAPLRCVAIAAALTGLLTAIPTGVAEGDPAPVVDSVSPPGGPPDGGGDSPLVTGGGPPAGTPTPPVANPGPPADTPNPPVANPGPPAVTPPVGSPGPAAAPPHGGGRGALPASPVHHQPLSLVSGQSTVIHLSRTPAFPPPSAIPPETGPAPAGPTPEPAGLEPATPAVVEPLKQPAVQQASLTRPAVVEMKLSDTTIDPGGRVTATGSGCGPTAPVGLSVDQSPAGTTAADAGGSFTLVLDTTALAVGRHDVTADCGGVKNVAFNVVLVNRVGTGAATSALIVILLLSGLWYFGHAILSPTDVRNRNA
jgi:hypothetical protein